MKPRKCDCCGKFRKEEDLFESQAEGVEWWVECRFCCSDFDLQVYFSKLENDTGLEIEDTF